MPLEGSISLQVDSLGCRNAQKDKDKFVQRIIFVVIDLPPFVTPRLTKLTPVLLGAGYDGGE